MFSWRCLSGWIVQSGKGEGDGGKRECRREELHCLGVGCNGVRWVIIIYVIAIVCSWRGAGELQNLILETPSLAVVVTF